MLKIFSTQLTGLYKKMMDEESFNFEDGGRLLAQAAISDGAIYLKGFKEMEGILSEAFHGAEPFPSAKPFVDNASLNVADRVILFTRYTTDQSALQLAKKLRDQQIPFVTIASSLVCDEESIEQYSDVHINLRLLRGLIPDETGNRVGFPHLMIALFAYYGIKTTLEEILLEYSEE
ncbi:DUF2529 domain-containing protein [Peribacillus huizhouensis]|uniref:DUF2529 domain-containing protein n=1 Tax=Peribacillus huizhouensis TaxID=1501239 RepID=A0ABR6CU88_9BACI|nr:DUF2529 domain-containing protein [Peribacillus huizhouensis]MBA9027897.1 hypothetical protein [Peribacillus huizhouensis]